MKWISEFDEKQLIDRGKAFQYGFLTAIAAIILNYFLNDMIEIKISPSTSFMFTLWVPLTICSIALIIKDAYDGVNSTMGMVGVSVFGFGGCFILVCSIIFLVTGKEVLIDNGMVTESVGHILNGVCMMTIGIVYWVKQYLNKKKFSED